MPNRIQPKAKFKGFKTSNLLVIIFQVFCSIFVDTMRFVIIQNNANYRGNTVNKLLA